MVKLRDLNKLRSRIGFSEVDSQMTKEIREITDTTVSIIIVLELNQSRSIWRGLGVIAGCDAGASYPVYGLDVFLRDLRVFVTALTSLITTPSPSRVVSVSPTFTCLTCFNTAPSAALVTL